MLDTPNALRWNGGPGHYEVYYLTLTDPETGVGLWIRYTMVAPLAETGEQSSAALWFLAMDPCAPDGGRFGRKTSFPIASLSSEPEPFELRIGDATLTDGSMRGAIQDVDWDLRWTPGRAYEHVHPLLRPIARTILVLPHADLAIEGTISSPGDGSRCAAPAADRRTCGAPSTPAPGRGCTATTSRRPGRAGSGHVRRRCVGDRAAVRTRGRPEHAGGGPHRRPRLRIDLAAARARQLEPLRAHGWRFEVVDGSRRLVGEVDAERDRWSG